MSDILKAKLIASDQVIASPVGDETVLLHLENGTYYGLDPVGTRIWELLQQGMAPLEICGTIAQEYEISVETAETDARSFLEDLKAQGIVFEG